MKHINCLVKLGYIDNPPLSKDMNTNLLYTGPYSLHRFPVARLKT